MPQNQNTRTDTGCSWTRKWRMERTPIPHSQCVLSCQKGCVCAYVCVLVLCACVLMHETVTSNGKKIEATLTMHFMHIYTQTVVGKVASAKLPLLCS